MSLSDLYDEKNIFAQIIQNKSPSFRIYEDDFTIAFLDIFPQGIGHTLIIPKNIKARNILDFPSDKWGNLMQSVQIVSRGLIKCFNADGIEIQQFNGAAAGQTVFHIHFHLIPRFNNISILPHNCTTRSNDSDLEKIADKIRPHILSKFDMS